MQLGKIGAAAIAGAFVLGGLLAVIVGGPIWLGSGYAALALVLWLLRTLHDRPTGVPPRNARARERVTAQPPRPAVTREPAAASDAPAVSGAAPAEPSPSNISAPSATTAPTATTAAQPGEHMATTAPTGNQTAPAGEQTAPVAPIDPDRVGASIASRAPVEPAWPAAPSGPDLDRSQAPARLSVTADRRQTASMTAPARDQRAARPQAPERTPSDAATHPRMATSASHPVQAASAAIGYMVSDTQATSDQELPDARGPIQARCRARGLTLITIARDTQATRTDERPALRWALEQLAADRAQTLIVTDLTHLGDSPAQLAQLLRWLDEHERTLIALDCGLDTSTEAGRIAANALIRIGARRQLRIPRPAPANEPGDSHRVSPRAAVSDVPELSDRIRRLRAQGMTLQAIADILNTEGIPTIRGGAKWRPSSVQAATGYRRPAPKRLDLPPGKHHE